MNGFSCYTGYLNFTKYRLKLPNKSHALLIIINVCKFAFNAIKRVFIYCENASEWLGIFFFFFFFVGGGGGGNKMR